MAFHHPELMEPAFGVLRNTGTGAFGLLLFLPCPLLGPSAVARLSLSVCCCSYRHGISLCTSAHLELVPLHTAPSLAAALLLFGRAPHVASAFLRLAEALRPPRLECRMEPAVRAAAATLAPQHSSLRQDILPVLSPGALRSLRVG